MPRGWKTYTAVGVVLMFLSFLLTLAVSVGGVSSVFSKFSFLDISNPAFGAQFKSIHMSLWGLCTETTVATTCLNVPFGKITQDLDKNHVFSLPALPTGSSVFFLLSSVYTDQSLSIIILILNLCLWLVSIVSGIFSLFLNNEILIDIAGIAGFCGFWTSATAFVIAYFIYVEDWRNLLITEWNMTVGVGPSIYLLGAACIVTLAGSGSILSGAVRRGTEIRKRQLEKQNQHQRKFIQKGLLCSPSKLNHIVICFELSQKTVMQNKPQNDSEPPINSSFLDSAIFPVSPVYSDSITLIPVLHSAGQPAMSTLMPADPPHISRVPSIRQTQIIDNYGNGDSKVEQRIQTVGNVNQNVLVSPLLSPNSNRIRISKSVTEFPKDKKPGDSFLNFGGSISIKRSSSKSKDYYGSFSNPKSTSTGETVRRFNSESHLVKSPKIPTVNSNSFDSPPAIADQNFSRAHQNNSDTTIDSILNSPNLSPNPSVGYEYYNNTTSFPKDSRRLTPEPTTKFNSEKGRMRSQSVVSDSRSSNRRNKLQGDKHLMNVGLIADSVTVSNPTTEILTPEIIKDKIDYTKMDPFVLAHSLHGNNLPGLKKSEISPIIGKGDDFHATVLAHYLDFFNFSGLSLDDAFRQFFLLNTDLNVVNLRANRRMKRKDFVKNTYDSIEKNISEDPVKYPPMPSEVRQLWKVEMENLLDELYKSIKDQPILQRALDVDASRSEANSETNSPMLNSANSFNGSVLDESNLSIHSNSSDSYNLRSIKKVPLSMSFGKKHRPKSSPNEYVDFLLGIKLDLKTDDDEKIPFKKSTPGHRKNSSASNMPTSILSAFSRSTALNVQEPRLTAANIVLEGLLIRLHLSDKDETKPKNRRWIKMWTELKIYSDGRVELHQLRSETTAEALGSSARAALSKSVDSGEIFIQQEISEYSSLTVKTSTQNSEDFNILHSVSTLLPNGYGARSNVISLRINNGSTYLYQAPTSELIVMWRDTLNYWAARRSKEPLRSGVSSINYGWGFILQEKRLREREEQERKKIFEELNKLAESDIISSTTDRDAEILKKVSKESIRSVQSFHTTESSDAQSTRNSISGLSAASISTSASHSELKKIKIEDWASPGGYGMI
ncbi:hypothetical protein HK096_009867, partial [Nowakowskiella sp. JEL0078]